MASTSWSPIAAHGDDDRDRHAALAGRAVAGRHRGVGRHVDVGVGQHHHVVLGAAERLHPLAVPGAGLVDVAGDRRRADEADRRDVGVLEQPVDGDLVAVHDVEHAVGHARLAQQLGHEQRDRRILLARLEHERVAARDGVGEHPHGHHGREVERRDAGHDAERLADGVHVDAARGLLGVAALQQVRDSARELDVLEARAPPRRARRRAPCRARTVRSDGDVLAVGVDQLADVEHDLRRGATAMSTARPGTPLWPRPRRASTSAADAKRPPAARRWPGSKRNPFVPTCRGRTVPPTQ